MADAPAPALDETARLDRELETILTSFDSNYVWNYGSVKEGLLDLYEKAKRDQWNGTTQLAWSTDVDPEGDIIPQSINPLADYATVGTNILVDTKDRDPRGLLKLFREDVRSGKLPQVSWIPAPEAYSEHPNFAPNYGAW